MKVPLPQVKEGRVLTDWVTASLREAILRDFFEPGEKLDQDLIATELSVSRTPVRESLKVLESEGFVEIRSHRGAFIVKITREDVQDVYEIRKLLEAEVARQVLGLIPDSVLDDLEKSLDEDKESLERGEPSRHFDLDSYFHEIILGYARNKLFRIILDNLNNRIIKVRRFALRQPGHLVESHQEHRKILQALRQRDSDGAADAMRNHLERSSQRIQEIIA